MPRSRLRELEMGSGHAFLQTCTQHARRCFRYVEGYGYRYGYWCEQGKSKMFIIACLALFAEFEEYLTFG
jgi:hypothetical protein